MLSPSTKSDSGSERPVSRRGDRFHRRLERTLRRATDYRPIEAEDIKYLWAGYKQGAFEGFALDADLSPEAFKQELERLVMDNCHAVWTLFGMTRRGFIPTGIVLAAYAPAAAYLIVSAAVWMPWATNRNIVECMVSFLSGVRKDHALMFYALPEHKRLYELCAMHSIVRRIGTSYVAIPGKAAAVFETRPLEKAH